MNADSHSPDKWLSFGLAFVGGYCDAAGFILAKTFTGHITGSLVLGAITVASRDWRAALAHFTATTCFLAGIPLSMLIGRLATGSLSWPIIRLAMGLEVILIVAGYFSLASHTAPAVELFVICLSLALGLQNGAFRRTGGISLHTTYLTGTITSLIASGAERFAFPLPSPRAPGPDPKVSLLSGLWAVFVLGAVLGAGAAFHFKAVGILGAALTLLVIIVHDSFVGL